MRLSASLGFGLLCAASLLWIVGSLATDEGSPSPLNLLRAAGFLVAALAIRGDEPRARLLGAGVLMAGAADLFSFPTVLQFLAGIEVAVEGSEFVGSIVLVVLGIAWLATARTPWYAALRWGVLLIGLTALYWVFASIGTGDYIWIPGNIAAAAGAGIAFFALPRAEP